MLEFTDMELFQIFLIFENKVCVDCEKFHPTDCSRCIDDKCKYGSAREKLVIKFRKEWMKK